MKMMDTVKLRTQNWGPLVCQGLYELYQEKIGFNVAIYGSDGGILDAHACVLMAVSPELKTRIADDPIQGCHSVEIDTITCDVWTVLLDFIYTGTVSVDRDMVHEVLNAAERLQMYPLVKCCKEYLNPNERSNEDLPPLISKRQGITQQSIRSSIMPIQAPQDAKPKQGDHGVPTDIPPLISQQAIRSNVVPMQLPRDAIPNIMPHKTEAAEPQQARTDQPLDLTKDISSATVPNLPPVPPMPGANTHPDAQMQAVMAVYYNQMFQYSMLAQKMQHTGQFNPMPKMPNGSTFPMPNMMPPVMPQMPSEESYGDGRQRKFACGICGMLFFTRHVKEQHELTHTNLKPYGCNICGFRARQKAVIWRHKKNRHPEADSSVSMDSLTMLPPESEMADAEDEEEEANDMPSEDSDGLSPVQQSSAAVQNTSSESIPATAQIAQDQPALQSSMMMSMDPTKPYACATCGRGFKNKYILSQHQMIHSNVRRYSCDICGFRAKQMSVIYNHKRNKHFGRKPDDPSAIFSPIAHPDQLPGVPMPPLSPSEDFKPKRCGTPRRDGSSMTDIEEEVRNAPRSENGFLCRLCNRHLKSKMILQEHIMTHYNIRRYSCCYCNYRAKQRAGLYNHMKVKHKGLKPIWPSKVKKSPFKFGSPSVRERLNRSFLNRSRQTNSFHIGIARKHSCRTCGKNFRMKSTLEKHELIHMNIKRFSCKYCGYKAKQKTVIQRHCEEHHPQMKVRMLDLYNENRGQSPVPPEELTQMETSEVEDLSQRKIPSPMKITPAQVNSNPVDLMEPTDLSLPSIPHPRPLRATMSPPPITRATEQRNPSIPSTIDPVRTSISVPNGNANGPVTLLNGNVGILQLELPKSQRDALESPNTNFPSYGTPDKPHRCKTCGRCFRLRHVMEQHELTHFNFRKYMCDICGFRAKQKAVIYRHKKVKHPNHPGAGRVTLVPEYGLPFARPMQPSPQMSAPNPPPQPGYSMPPQSMMNAVTQPTMAPTPIMVAPSPQMKLSPSNNPELAHNNNKGSPQDANLVQDLSIKREEMKEVREIKPIPIASLLPSQAGKSWYMKPNSDRSDSGEDDDTLRPGENLATNMAMGLPSMAPASQSFMSLPLIAPLSPESNSNSPNGTPDKKYSCQVCGRSFKHRHVLEQHYITHTGLRPYKCEFCDFCARQKASLWRHKQKHLNQQL